MVDKYRRQCFVRVLRSLPCNDNKIERIHINRSTAAVSVSILVLVLFTLHMRSFPFYFLAQGVPKLKKKNLPKFSPRFVGAKSRITRIAHKNWAGLIVRIFRRTLYLRAVLHRIPCIFCDSIGHSLRSTYTFTHSTYTCKQKMKTNEQRTRSHIRRRQMWEISWI